ncbi:MAG: PhoH family protein [candidate division KSB1 bacterium]|nr:PhoH family protein [candidate division KSB1 bacterium]
MSERRISIRGIDHLGLLGLHDANLRRLQEAFDATIVVRGGEIVLRGDEQELDALERIFNELIFILNRTDRVTEGDVDTVTQLVLAESRSALERRPEGAERSETAVGRRSVILYSKSGAIRPKSAGQQRYYEATLENDIVFVIGPAGTGKTYLAVAIAVAALRERQVERIILTRPAVEAGESLGYLPGDLREKIEPYLRPLYDALHDMIPAEKLRKLMETNTIEIAPLAYMRGRTLNNAYVILDEAQNTSALQMKMFLTRLGVNSKAIITGDITQVDLPSHAQSGLVQIQDVLKGIEGIAFVYLDDTDVVRHRLVREIIRAYDAYDAARAAAGEKTPDEVRRARMEGRGEASSSAS